MRYGKDGPPGLIGYNESSPEAIMGVGSTLIEEDACDASPAQYPSPARLHRLGGRMPIIGDDPLNNPALSAKARIRIRRPPAEVFAAFADAGAMSQFWFSRRDAGLKEGETVAWFLDNGEHTVSFDVRVEELRYPNKLVISWERDGASTQITWTLEATERSDTILTIEESGFAGGADGRRAA